MFRDSSANRAGRLLHTTASVVLPAVLLLLLTPVDAGSRFWPNKQ